MVYLYIEVLSDSHYTTCFDDVEDEGIPFSDQEYYKMIANDLLDWDSTLMSDHRYGFDIQFIFKRGDESLKLKIDGRTDE